MLSRKTAASFVTALFLCVVVLGLGASADSRARIVRLSYVDGEVELDRRDGRGFAAAFMNMPVIDGARLLTRDDARAEVELEDGSTLRFTPGTEVEFSELGLRSDGGKVTIVDLVEGTMYVRAEHDRDDDLRIMAAGQQITLSKDAQFRIRLTRSDLDVAVFKGELEVLSRAGQRIEVRKNETVQFELEDANRYFLARDVREGRYDQWDRERDDFRKRQSQYARGYRDGYRSGMYDLAYWGSYYDVPGYGRLWRPRHVGYSWDPFHDGAWVWYPHTGYVWVSHHPWGWAPYRYGSWVFVSNYGWCWRSGGFQTWSPVTVVVNAPSGYRHPRRPPSVSVNAGGVTPTTPAVIPVGRGARTGRDIGDLPADIGKGRHVGDDDGFGNRRRLPNSNVPASGAVSGGAATGTSGTTSADTSGVTTGGRRPRRMGADDAQPAGVGGRRVGDGGSGEVTAQPGGRLERPGRESGEMGSQPRHERVEQAPVTERPRRMENDETPAPRMERPVERPVERPAERAVERPGRTTRDDSPRPSAPPPARTERQSQPERTYSPPPSAPPAVHSAPSAPPPSRPAGDAGSRPVRTSRPD